MSVPRCRAPSYAPHRIGPGSAWRRVPALAGALAFALALPWVVACRPEADMANPEPDTMEAAPAPAAEAPLATPEPEPPPVAAELEPPEDAEPEPPPGTWRPLTEEQIAILFSTQEDDVPEYRQGITDRQANFHYTSGNERTLDAYYPKLTERMGGAYVGVGTDQAYLFMSWARVEIAWLIDYDPVIQEIHELYRLFFTTAQTPTELVSLWSSSGSERALEVIAAAHDEDRAKKLSYWYKGSRARIHRRLKALTSRFEREDVPTFLTDQEHYDYVRMMLEQRRVRPLLVNLLDDEGLLALSRATEKLGVPVRVLYLSNAEQYWKRYSPEFRRNIGSLPFSDDAVVLRTLLSQAINEDYRYNLQPATNYVQWLSRPFVINVYQIVRGGPAAKPEGITLFESNRDPDRSAAGKKWYERHPNAAPPEATSAPAAAAQ
ncbi:LIC_10091 family protein [Paraliomyxa miuraensis]|uniref:LIC_10091 family protein n=1 Tax=Paraliomyxa miuraensis TaxID=376150 RepID=UPI0022539EBD|nr:hypothetical protein [Paraliomyxa miuraensis]MCX4245089.1 hypothetical protein [Paraliomyxa miuraensis]